MRTIALCVAVAAVFVSAAGGGTAVARTAPTPAHPPGIPVLVPKGPKAARHIALQNAAYALINRAGRQVWAARPSCKPSIPRPSSKTTHDTPGQPTLDAVAALRRPAEPGDAFPPDVPGVLGETYVDYTRSVTSAGGKSFYILVARSVPVSYPSAACLEAEHVRLVKLLRGRPHTLRATALEAFGRIRSSQQHNSATPTSPQDSLWLFSKGPGGTGLGGGGGGAGISSFMAHGMFFASGGEHSSTLVGLVPDGVATVTLHYPRTVSRGRWYKPAVFPSAFTRTVRVQQNVLVVHVPRGNLDAFAARMIWRSADGKVVRVARAPGLRIGF